MRRCGLRAQGAGEVRCAAAAGAEARAGEGRAAGDALPHRAGILPGSRKQPERLAGDGEVLQPCEGSYDALDFYC